MKSLLNIFLIILLALGLTSMPLFLSPIDYSSTIELDQPSQPDKKIELISLSGYSLDNPSTLSLEISSNGDFPLSKPKSDLYSLEIYSGANLIKKINGVVISSSEFINDAYFLNQDLSYESILDLSQTTLALPNGTYKIIVIPKIIEVSDKKIELEVQYTLDGVYINSMNEAPENTSGFMIYLSDKNDRLIPVTTFVKPNNLPHKILLSLYESESFVDNLLNPMGAINYIILRDRVIYIDIPAKDMVYNLQNKKAQNAYWAFVKTFSQLEGVLKVRFTVDNLVLEEFFYGKNIRYAIDYNHTNKIYLPVLVGDRYYLSDMDVENSEALTPDEILISIHDSIKDYFTVDYTYTLDRSIVELNFNDSLFEKKLTQDKYDMLIESIIYSCTSILGIDSIKINSVNGIDAIGSYRTNEVLYPAKYINPVI
ncbi:MAG: GerMN domain-containing protein [Tissierellales bacterium]|nr:GerMN domain-containing protein [Tissierellales bacterium]MBN2828679.1 GerMN domain-containing protein [Tissierellales bacterium]